MAFGVTGIPELLELLKLGGRVAVEVALAAVRAYLRRKRRAAKGPKMSRSASRKRMVR